MVFRHAAACREPRALEGRVVFLERENREIPGRAGRGLILSCEVREGV